MSNAGGRANSGGSATGAPGDGNQTCGSAGCHSSGSLDVSIAIEMLDADGNPVDKYIPGTTYQMRVTNTSTDSPGAYGFQMVSLLDADDSVYNAWSDEGSGVQISSIGTKTYAEHLSPSSSGVFEVKWTAPEISTGSVSFYVGGNAVNLNGGTSGDGSTTTSLTIEEDASSSIDIIDLADVRLSPNPAVDFINVSVAENVFTNVVVMDLSGRILNDTNINSETTQVNISDFSPGIYMVKLIGEHQQLTKRIVKK